MIARVAQCMMHHAQDCIQYVAKQECAYIEDSMPSRRPAVEICTMFKPLSIDFTTIQAKILASCNENIGAEP